MSPTTDQRSPPRASLSHADQIDALLERYLGLLDEYTRLRSELSDVLGNAHHSIARANYSAERGVRYDSSAFDERMRAVRGVEISTIQDNDNDDKDTREFMDKSVDTVGAQDGEERESQHGPEPHLDKTTTTASQAQISQTSPSTIGDLDIPRYQVKTLPASFSSHHDKKEGGPGEGKDTTQPNRPRDPLRWFGIMVPQPLRSAQASAVRAVEELIPRLVEIDAAMREVEIGVRRARKKASKNDRSDKSGRSPHLAESKEEVETGVEEVVGKLENTSVSAQG